MAHWEQALDRWLTTPPEPDVIGECDYCGGDLYANCDYLHDRNDDEWFCDDECYLDKKREDGDLGTEIPEGR